MPQKMRVVIPGGLYPAMSRESLETAAAKAPRLIVRELSRLNWAHEYLIHRAHSNPYRHMDRQPDNIAQSKLDSE